MSLHAHVEYDEDVPAASRSRNPQDALKPGVEVRITAEQGSDGEWRASRIEILDSGAGAGTLGRRGPAGRRQLALGIWHLAFGT